MVFGPSWFLAPPAVKSWWQACVRYRVKSAELLLASRFPLLVSRNLAEVTVVCSCTVIQCINLRVFNFPVWADYWSHRIKSTHCLFLVLQLSTMSVRSLFDKKRFFKWTKNSNSNHHKETKQLHPGLVAAFHISLIRFYPKEKFRRNGHHKLQIKVMHVSPFFKCARDCGLHRKMKLALFELIAHENRTRSCTRGNRLQLHIKNSFWSTSVRYKENT